ncbi:hypothetical protein [Desulfurivibrio alkaliphilus]|uniref:hypothetical protein n=1 Tax=Desulfurivibrio alkaliphilus TaxID=427923 RepID=UPI0012FF2361|nr:hypothetical protein [Desulfurivibrio alkaliphilus]
MPGSQEQQLRRWSTPKHAGAATFGARHIGRALAVFPSVVTLVATPLVIAGAGAGNNFFSAAHGADIPALLVFFFVFTHTMSPGKMVMSHSLPHLIGKDNNSLYAITGHKQAAISKKHLIMPISEDGRFAGANGGKCPNCFGLHDRQ